MKITQDHVSNLTLNPPTTIQHVQHLPATHTGKALNAAHFAHYVSSVDLKKPSAATIIRHYCSLMRDLEALLMSWCE